MLFIALGSPPQQTSSLPCSAILISLLRRSARCIYGFRRESKSSLHRGRRDGALESPCFHNGLDAGKGSRVSRWPLREG